MRSRRSYKKYSEEFKRRAVDLAKELGCRQTAAERLGISPGNLHNWVHKAEDPKESRPLFIENPGEELIRLRKENDQLKKTNEILKAADAFFSQDHLK